MSDIKCPVCNKQMKIGTLDTDDGMGTVWMSIMPCDCVCSYGASKAVWQELIRTRKALEIAVRAIETIKYSKKSDAINLRHKANKALIEIYKIKDQTALEQKDVK